MTSIQWTLWGIQAANAAEYLGRGSHVKAVGRLVNNHYEDLHGDKVCGFTFTCEEIDYPDSKAESETRGAGQCTPEQQLTGRASASPLSHHHGVGLR